MKRSGNNQHNKKTHTTVERAPSSETTVFVRETNFLIQQSTKNNEPITQGLTTHN